jgi:hypothetical protein
MYERCSVHSSKLIRVAKSHIYMGSSDESLRKLDASRTGCSVSFASAEIAVDWL